MNDSSFTQTPWGNRARSVLPGGTFGNTPSTQFICSAHGSRVWDENGKEYIDYLLGSGPMLIGHAHPDVVKAVSEQLERGSTYFATNPKGVELAEMIVEAFPCAEKVRFASTGSEADAFAIRLARAYRNRPKIIKFEGGYHGYSDYGLLSLAPKRPSNSSTPIRDSAGIPDAVCDDVLIAPFNDIDAVASLIEANKGTIAAVLMEPFQRNIPPLPGFLESIREITEQNDILLIFDEVVTGFRLAYGGAQEYYGVIPDLFTLGKVVGGGFPLSAVAGREDVMALFDKTLTSDDHFVPQVGTLSGNPVAAAAGIATLKILKQPGAYERLFNNGTRLMSALAEILKKAGFDAEVAGCPPMFDVVFAKGRVVNYRDSIKGDPHLMSKYNQIIHQQGLFKGSYRYYVSIALDDDDLDQTMDIWERSIGMLKKSEQS